MLTETVQAASRRKFLQFLAASSALTCSDAIAFAETLLPKNKLPDPMTWAPLDANNLIKSPKDAINVFDFEPVMRQNVPPAHFGYMASGIDDEVTLRANRDGLPQIPVAAAAADRREQGRHERRHPRHPLRLADHGRADRRP